MGIYIVDFISTSSYISYLHWTSFCVRNAFLPINYVQCENAYQLRCSRNIFIFNYKANFIILTIKTCEMYWKCREIPQKIRQNALSNQTNKIYMITNYMNVGWIDTEWRRLTIEIHNSTKQSYSGTGHVRH